MTTPARRLHAWVKREPNFELPHLDGRVTVIPAGWRYTVRDLSLHPALQVVAAGVVGSQPEALERACWTIREWSSP